MNMLPKTTMDYRGLYQILMGLIKARLMLTGIELKIFSTLKAFCSAEDVAREIGADPENTERFLDALTTIDPVEKKKGRYRNFPLTQAFLSEESPDYKGTLFQMIEMQCMVNEHPTIDTPAHARGP